ncbi:DUF5626 family protein [Lachnoclostridium sp. An181]|uniref:DUF5626 family protein n=1 Tax=Lachnoclostridium sp. An181 TaxID=1965575 RepID=UPI0013A60C87|nr:DUF5626 family protein [Lachnoclostridium sp. An181]
MCVSSPFTSVSYAVSPKTTSTFAEYDLNVGGTQTFTIQNKNIKLNIIITEEMPIMKLANKTYSISFTSPLAWKAGYKVNIHNNSIASVHSAWNKEITGKILSARLKKESSKQATYYLTYQRLGFVTSPGVRVTISGTTMKVFGI